MKDEKGAIEIERRVCKLTDGLTIYERNLLIFKLLFWFLAYQYAKQRKEVSHVFFVIVVSLPLFGLDRCYSMKYFTVLFLSLTALVVKRFIGW